MTHIKLSTKTLATTLLLFSMQTARAQYTGILNGTLAAAIGLGLQLWLVGAVLWFVCQIAAVWATRRDAAFVDVVRRHLRYPTHLVAS
jgi:type IV secretory pathway TrbD component